MLSDTSHKRKKKLKICTIKNKLLSLQLLTKKHFVMQSQNYKYNTMGPAIAMAGSQLGSGFFGYLGQRQANKTNLKLAEQARQHDISMWNRTNEYNTPQMQMQRFKEAGLNPNLIYGQGNEGNAPQAPKAPVPQVENELTSLAQMSALPVISAYQDWRVKNAQIDNINANTKATLQNASLTALRGVTQDYMNKRHKSESFYYDQNAQNLAAQKSHISNYWQQRYQKEKIILDKHLPAQLNQIILRNNLLEQQKTALKLENDFNQNLKPYGIRSTDPILMRLIMHVLPKLNNKHLNRFLK